MAASKSKSLAERAAEQAERKAQAEQAEQEQSQSAEESAQESGASEQSESAFVALRYTRNALTKWESQSESAQALLWPTQVAVLCTGEPVSITGGVLHVNVLHTWPECSLTWESTSESESVPTHVALPVMALGEGISGLSFGESVCTLSTPNGATYPLAYGEHGVQREPYGEHESESGESEPLTWERFAERHQFVSEHKRGNLPPRYWSESGEYLGKEERAKRAASKRKSKSK